MPAPESEKTVTLVADGFSGDQDLEYAMAQLLNELFSIFKKKQKSYGPKNISTFGERGVVVRMNDKLQRLIRLVWDGVANPLQDENIRDTYIDMADYALIALLVRDGKWPE
jgi:hypothetical protein